MNDNWKEEGFKVFNKLFGESFNLKEMNLSLKGKPNLNVFIESLGVLNKIKENIDINLSLDMPLKDFFEKFNENIVRIIRENPTLSDKLKQISEEFKTIFQSVETHKELLAIPRDDEYEEIIRKRFFEELERAEKISKRAIAKSFQLALSYIEHLQTPDELFRMSNYNKLGIKPEKLKTDTTLEFFSNIFNMIFQKKQELLKLPDYEINNYISELIRRLGSAIEPYLKVIIVSIYNLQKISKEKYEKFDNFKKSFGPYLRHSTGLNIRRSDKENYLDYRNAIKHDVGYKVLPDRESQEIKIVFNLERKSKENMYWKKQKIMDLNELERFFRDFRKFQNVFFSFYEVYIKSIYKNYGYKFSSLKYIVEE